MSGVPSPFISNSITNPVLYEELGDCPNKEVSVNKKNILWQDIKTNNGWKLQINLLTGISRIVDDNGIHKAWGSPVIMKEKFKRLTRKSFLQKGDIIGVSRSKAMGLYEHYGIYAGNNRVIHYSGSGNDFDYSIAVRISSLEEFLKEDEDYFILFISSESKKIHKIWSSTNFHKINIGQNDDFLRLKVQRIFSDEETVQRALSRLGEKKYNLVTNNCEHFAIWCKTGVEESVQVKQVTHTVAELWNFINL
jgi:hypothetical protein